MFTNITNPNCPTTFISSLINTPLGPLYALSDEHSLYFLGFLDRNEIKKEIERIVNKWDLADESGIEEWFRLFMLLESDKLWPTSSEMPETLWDKISPRIPEFIPRKQKPKR